MTGLPEIGRWWVTGADAEMADHAIEDDVIRGWRAWHVVHDDRGVRLVSLWLNADWPARRRIESACDRHGPHPPLDHACGIHAFKATEDALGYVGERVPFVGFPFVRSVENRACLAVGRVSLWGRVVEHADGWRGQFAYPYDIFLVGGSPQLARELAAVYAVDVVSGRPDQIPRCRTTTP